MKTRIVIFFSLLLVLSLFSACTSLKRKEDMRDFRKEVREDNQNMSNMEEANLDESLDPVEQKAVDKVFDENRKETERTEKTIF